MRLLWSRAVRRICRRHKKVSLFAVEIHFFPLFAWLWVTFLGFLHLRCGNTGMVFKTFHRMLRTLKFSDHERQERSLHWSKKDPSGDTIHPWPGSQSTFSQYSPSVSVVWRDRDLRQKEGRQCCWIEREETRTMSIYSEEKREESCDWAAEETIEKREEQSKSRRKSKEKNKLTRLSEVRVHTGHPGVNSIPDRWHTITA